MSRTASMTTGLVLIMIGAQLYLVKSYLLSPTASRFVEEHFNSNSDSRFTSATAPPAANQPPSFNTGFGTAAGQRSNSGNSSWNANGNPIGSSAVGQSWPYYRTDNVNSAGKPVYGNSSFQTPASINAQSVPAFGGNKRFVPPGWIMWPALFLGAVMFLHGAALKN